MKNYKLRNILKNLKRVVIAYSGGLDSTFLLKAAVDTLGRDNVLAVTARSATYPDSERREARLLAEKIGARHITIRTKELASERFVSNPVDRCYYCKKELFKRLKDMASVYKMNAVIDGTNYDDLKDIRYGRKAALELGVRSPLLESGIAKSDIRRYSKTLKLPTHDKPSMACLASRVPFGQKIDKSILGNIEKAEEFLHGMGIRQVRVRAHGDIARIEVARKDFQRIISIKDAVVRGVRRAGFTYVALDLTGYRTGSMHEGVR